MRIRVVSDLHVDLQADRGASLIRESMSDAGYDVLVVAGDLCESGSVRDSLALVSAAAAGRPVMYVLGNHEYWGSGFPEIVDTSRKAAADLGVHLLETEVVEIRGQRFVGSTHWYEVAKVTPFVRSWSDFHQVSRIGGWIQGRASASARFLGSEVRDGDVVVTHMLPHIRSIHATYKGEPANRFFLHPVPDVVEQRGAALWIHGHTHRSMDYVAGRTRVVCNPFGYLRARGEPNPEFDPLLTVEV